MNIPDLIAKAKVLHEALPYIQDFRGATFVVKYGGSFMDDPDPTMRQRVATDIAFLAAVGINVVVVHGGGKAISRAMEGSGLKANFINGLRAEYSELLDCHEVRVRSAENKVVVSCHCAMDGALPITEVHDVTAAVRALATHVWEEEDLSSPLAEGALPTLGMIVAPCSVKTLAELAQQL